MQGVYEVQERTSGTWRLGVVPPKTVSQLFGRELGGLSRGGNLSGRRTWGLALVVDEVQRPGNLHPPRRRGCDRSDPGSGRGRLCSRRSGYGGWCGGGR